MGNGTSPKDAIEGIPSQEELVEHIKKTRPTSSQNLFQWIFGILSIVLFFICEYFALSSLYQAERIGGDYSFGFGKITPYLVVFALVYLANGLSWHFLKTKFIGRGFFHIHVNFNDQVYCKHNGVIYVFGAPRYKLLDFRKGMESTYNIKIDETIFDEDLAKEANAWAAFRIKPKENDESKQSNTIEEILSGKIHVHSQKPILPEEKAGS